MVNKSHNYYLRLNFGSICRQIKCFNEKSEAKIEVQPGLPFECYEPKNHLRLWEISYHLSGSTISTFNWYGFYCTKSKSNLIKCIIHYIVWHILFVNGFESLRILIVLIGFWVKTPLFLANNLVKNFFTSNFVTLVTTQTIR